MKISILSFYSGIANRGVERFVEEFKQRLDNDYQITVYKGPSFFLLPKKSNQLLRKLYLDYTSRQIALFTLKSLKKLWQEKPEILMPTNNGWQSVFCKVYCLLTGTKLVLTGHSGLGQDDKVNLWLFPDVFVVFSESQKRWAQKVNPKVKIIKIPHAVDLARFNPGAKAVKLNLEKPVILCVASREKFKNIFSTVKAVAELKKGSLLLIGDQEPEIVKLGNNLLGDGRFQSLTVPFEDMPGYYKASDLFTLASESCEAFGLAYLEALACNKPVVATCDLLRREIIGRAGLFLKNPKNYQDYAKTLKKSLEKNWQDRPRKQAEKFSWQRATRDYKRLFEALRK